ncbi:protein takeout [Halyomorpha halys]|uniref:protein takeout n=1 Tax=Halyomorpha halys TaxID=286706 RepID=UPI0006D4D51B|nr:protein takeout [Halyomorpha halys]
MSSVLYLVLLFGAAVSAKHVLPSYVKTCLRNDPKLNECALKNGKEIIPKIIKGDPSIRLPVLDPMVLDKVGIRTTGRTNGGGLQLTCYKCNVHGLGNAVLKDIKIDLAKKHIDLKIFLPQLTVSGKYDVNGKLLLFPITGKGQANLTLIDLDVEAGLDWKLIKRKGSEYAHISRDRVDFTTSRFKLSLTGLFGGDKALSDNMNQILNDNWREVLDDLKPSISGTVGEIIKFTLNNIFDMIPYELFFPEK